MSKTQDRVGAPDPGPAGDRATADPAETAPSAVPAGDRPSARPAGDAKTRPNADALGARPAADAPGAGPAGVERAFFHEVYQGEAPWDIGRPQPEVVRLLEAHRFEGPVLDVGCGTGENAILLAMAGYDVTAVDLVPRAVEQGREAARERGIGLEWLVGDALALPELVEGRRYATVLDAGLLHVFSDADRSRYAQALAAVTRPAGHLHVIVFSEEEAAPGGPRRVARAELEETFASGWHLDELVATRYHIRGREGGARAWRGTWRRHGITS